MAKNAFLRAAIGACLLQFGAAPLCDAADWSPQLIPSARGERGPAEPIRLGLPELPISVLERLVLELDDFDVTAFVTREGADAVFTPPLPLAYGTHQLRVVERQADGSVVERGSWTIDIRKSGRFREAELRAASTLNATFRVADRGLPENPPGKAQGDGAVQLAGTLADGDWRVQGRADFIYNSQETLLPRQNSRVDAGDFLIGFTDGPISATAGHQSVAPDSLVVQGANRRGLSVGFGRDTDPAKVTAFSARMQPITGFGHGLGVSDGGNRISGVTVVGKPVPGDGEALVVSTTYVAGEGPTQTGTLGSGVVGDPITTGGRAGGVVAESALFSHRLRLRGEYAASRFDFDGPNAADEEQSDRAYAALATYAPLPDLTVSGDPASFQIGLENKRIGTFFRSPANPVGAIDRKGTRGFAGLRWAGIDIQASLGRDTDNVNDLAQLPRTETTHSLVNLMVAPVPVIPPPTGPGETPVTPWYGQPVLSLTYVNQDQKVVKPAADLILGELHDTRMLTAASNFTYPAWTWSLSHTLGTDQQFGAAPSDTRSQTTQLGANARLGELAIGPSAQRATIQNRMDGSKDSRTLAAILNLAYNFTPRVSGNLNYTATRQEVDDASMNVRTRDVRIAVAWVAVPVQAERPGVTVALEGQHRDVADRVSAANDQSSYQIFLKTSVSWLPVF